MQLTLSQVAKLFSSSENDITRWIKNENLPVHQLESHLRFDSAELLEWAATTKRAFSPAIFHEISSDLVKEVSLADALERGGVALHVQGNNRDEVLHAAIGDMPLPAFFDRENLLQLLISREKSGGTAIGNGIAIPHPRYPVVLPGGTSVVRACYLEHPLDFHARDGELVDTLFLMVCPTVHEHLHLLARLSSFFRSEDSLKLLRSRPDKGRLVSAVRAEEATYANGKELQKA